MVGFSLVRGYEYIGGGYLLGTIIRGTPNTPKLGW
jgi:hypothetical protein